MTAEHPPAWPTKVWNPIQAKKLYPEWPKVVPTMSGLGRVYMARWAFSSRPSRPRLWPPAPLAPHLPTPKPDQTRLNYRGDVHSKINLKIAFACVVEKLMEPIIGSTGRTKAPRNGGHHHRLGSGTGTTHTSDTPTYMITCVYCKRLF